MQQGEAIGLSSSYAPTASEVVGAEIVDDYTIQFTLEVASCEGLRRVSEVDPIPAHAYGWEPEMGEDFDWGSFIDHPMDLEPTVNSGVFTWNRMEPGTAVYLSPNQDYPDSTMGGVLSEGYVFLDVPDENVLAERFLANRADELNIIREIQSNKGSILESDATVADEPGRVWHYVAMNLADPNNPQNGKDEAGNLIDQGHHPIFGDIRVRQALQHAMNIEEVINGPLDGFGTAMTAGTTAGAWTLNPDLERRAFDLDAARALLDEAGWVASGDPLVDGGDGLRVATEDALYAEPGTELVFEIMNVGDVRGDVSVVLQDQFAQIGADVIVTVLDFNAMYDDNMGAQTFDAAVAGWRQDLPFNPDQRNFFGVDVDIYGEGYGFNFGSWYNEEFEAINEQIANLPGCDPEERKALAYRSQEILFDEQPYLWLYSINSMYAALPAVQNFAPYPNFPDWNVDAQFVAQ
jgi:peptide/nickel transport system substrate-binding protein